MRFFDYSDQFGRVNFRSSVHPVDIMRHPLLNKGLAFNAEERDTWSLHGLLPPHTATLDEQLERVYQNFKAQAGDFERYTYLRSLQDTNEILFYRFLVSHVTEALPIVYTPTVGEACQKFSQIYDYPRGLFLSYPNQDKIEQILSHERFDAVRAIVVSDGERILGLGDQGAGGMGIPIGKLSLYSACAGIHPALTLPILLDTGTNNPDRIADPHYIGWKHERIRGKDYDDFIDRFVQAVKKRFPHILLQWEDFAQINANPILARYRDQLCTFNDDIQGTAAIAVGTLLAAVRVTGVPLKDQTIAVVGGGSAGCGISHLIMQAMMADGLSEAEASKRFYVIDREGLLLETQKNLLDFQKIFAKKTDQVSAWSVQNRENISIQNVIKNAQPTVLLGVSGQPGIFTKEMVVDMCQYAQRPIILPLSNPTSRSEATPADLMEWSQGKVIIGTGSPFPPVMKNGQSFRVDQTNNAYIFPGMGLGVLAVCAQRVTDRMFMAASKALADCSPTCQDKEANLLPPLSSIRQVSSHVAFAVAKQAIQEGWAEPCDDETLAKKIQAMVWDPAYPIFANHSTENR